MADHKFSQHGQWVIIDILNKMKKKKKLTLGDVDLLATPSISTSSPGPMWIETVGMSDWAVSDSAVPPLALESVPKSKSLKFQKGFLILSLFLWL